MQIEVRGHEEMRELMECVFATIQDFDYFDEVGDERTRALFYRARVGRQPVEEATLVRFDRNAKVREITIWFRPLPGLAAVTGRLGPKLVRARGGRLRGALAAAMMAPLAPLTRVGDRLAVRLLRRRS